MKSTFFAAATGLAAVAHATSNPSVATASGKAIIISYCSENVYLQNTPSGSSYTETTILNSTNKEYSQYYSQLEDNDGWSIKFGPSSDLSSIMQYEYTWQGTGEPVWYDMSLVNSAGSELYTWEFVSSDTSSCNPDMADYFTDATTTTGMQTECADTIDLTLYICTDESSSASSAVASASSSAATVTSKAASTSATSTPATIGDGSTTTAAVTTATTAKQTTLATSTSTAAQNTHHYQNDVEESSTAATTSTAANGNVVTEYDVAYVTEVATYTAYVTERDAEATPAVHRRHVHGHPHARN